MATLLVFIEVNTCSSFSSLAIFCTSLRWNSSNSTGTSPAWRLDQKHHYVLLSLGIYHNIYKCLKALKWSRNRKKGNILLYVGVFSLFLCNVFTPDMSGLKTLVVISWIAQHKCQRFCTIALFARVEKYELLQIIVLTMAAQCWDSPETHRPNTARYIYQRNERG